NLASKLEPPLQGGPSKQKGRRLRAALRARAAKALLSGRSDEVSDGSRTQPLGTHRTPRPSGHAADEPLASAAVDSPFDDCGDAHGRWLDLVWPGRVAFDLRRHAAIRGGRFGGARPGFLDLCFLEALKEVAR